MDKNVTEYADRLAEIRTMMVRLQSVDKKARKQSLEQLQELLTKTASTHENLREIFNETHMYTLNCMRDKAESVREQAIRFITFFVIEKLPLNDFYLTYVFPVLVERLGSVEIIEESEEIRLQLIELLRQIIAKYSNTQQLKPFLNDSITILKESVKDKHPAIKESSCKCIVELARALPADFHMQSENLVKSTLTCFSHQRYKVRVEAVATMGEIVIHSPYSALNEAIGPLAERLFDQIPIVRRTVAQVAYRWLTEYRDRYSFFHKILPLLLTGLNDEVDETRLESQSLWDQVGLQYQQENEKDLKDQLDYPKHPEHYPLNLTRPNLGCRILVQRNVGKLTKALSAELLGWQEDVRTRCSQLLCAIALHAEDSLTHHLQELLPAMYSAARDHDTRVVQNIIRSCEIMGLFIPPEVWFQLVLPVIEHDGANSGHLSVLSSLLSGYHGNDSKLLRQLTRLLADDSICLTRKKTLQVQLLKCLQVIGEKICKGDDNPDVKFDLFKIGIALIALRDEENRVIITSDSIISTLGRFFNCDIYQVWSLNLNRLLGEIKASDPKIWTDVTPHRCIFDVILTESGEAFGENLDVICDILEESLDPQCDPDSRLKTFLSLANAFDRKETIFKRATNLGIFFQRLILEVFVPSLVWHAGLTAEALRTMSAACLLCAVTPATDLELFPDDTKFCQLFAKLLPLLLSLSEDASYRSRQLAIDILKMLKIHASNKNTWSCDDLVTIYPEILKRLDDPTDKVRISALSALIELFTDAPDEFKGSHFRAHHELIVDTLMTHFDDHDEEVQKLVYEILKVVAHINKEELCKKVKRHKPIVRNHQGCDDVLAYLQQLDVPVTSC